MVSKSIQKTRIYKANQQALLHSGKRYVVNEGGARSGKTYSILQLLIGIADNWKGLSITVCSHSLPHLKRGALRDFLEIMDKWGLYDESSHNHTDQVYQFPSGSYIEFVGLEDPGKARGPGRDILFINEANLVSKALFDQLDMRTRKKVLLDLNPADFDCWCYGVADGPDAVCIRSSYKDNPYLPQSQIRVIEAYKDADPLMWKVFGLGERGTSAEQIYTHWKLCDKMPEGGERWYGMDFGYTVPTGMVKVVHYEGAIYAEEMIYQTHMATQDRIERLKSLAISEWDEIIADAAEPDSIAEMYNAGFNMYPAVKDVWAGIMKVKSMPLYVLKSSKNLIKELGSYKWKKDKNDKILEEPVKENDHLVDALRYAVFTKLKNPGMDFFIK
jgi:phage terminase large subunit